MTKLPFTGTFRITSLYKAQGNLWASGFHGGIDLVGENKNVYSICNGTVERAGYDNGGFGNYVRIKENGTENRIYLAHLQKIYVKVGQSVTPLSIVGYMGQTGNATGPHTHVEIREFRNGVAVRKLNPASYMGIPNRIGTYQSKNYELNTVPSTQTLKTLARNTNLRTEPTIKAGKTLYLKNTTLYILENAVKVADGYTWDKVKIRVNNKTGYMINQNYQ